MEFEAKGKRTRASISSFTVGDRLSSLPDCLIHHIMSFMKARQVVQTCVLSTRWKHLWRSVPSLNIDLEEFKTEGAYHANVEERKKFEDFTDHLLIPNNISIALLDKFQLHVHHYHREEAARWIRHGIKYSTQEPGIRPQGLSSTPWRLKRLHLSNINLDDSFAKHISSGCQNLEDLELKGCPCHFHEITSHTLKNLILKDCSSNVLSAITSQTLKRLVISGCYIDDGPLVVMAPVVSYLLLSVAIYNFKGGIVLNEIPSIVKVSIHLVNNSDCPSKLGDDQFNLLDSVSKVTSLHLSAYKAMVLTEEFPQFENLKTLLLEKCDLSDNFQTLGHFLQSSPSLEKLTLRNCKFSKDPKKKKGKVKLNKQSLSQLDVRCKNLKQTEIIYRNDDVHKLEELLLSIAGSLPENNIKLTKVDSP
ncbi:hypothetical protein HU200_027324 [Digitaria exilis]|uniref:F-box domain-containing protein n=1 Tax=Digitaria exilis TaxID=1010633 RepID=A0A835EWB0_9POAL|nr:hypothetical protein HU200_027324 [Digitaria exilis]